MKKTIKLFLWVWQTLVIKDDKKVNFSHGNGDEIIDKDKEQDFTTNGITNKYNSKSNRKKKRKSNMIKCEEKKKKFYF